MVGGAWEVGKQKVIARPAIRADHFGQTCNLLAVAAKTENPELTRNMGGGETRPRTSITAPSWAFLGSEIANYVPSYHRCLALIFPARKWHKPSPRPGLPARTTRTENLFNSCFAAKSAQQRGEREGD